MTTYRILVKVPDSLDPSDVLFRVERAIKHETGHLYEVVGMDGAESGRQEWTKAQQEELLELKQAIAKLIAFHRYDSRWSGTPILHYVQTLLPEGEVARQRDTSWADYLDAVFGRDLTAPGIGYARRKRREGEPANPPEGTLGSVGVRREDGLYEAQAIARSDDPPPGSSLDMFPVQTDEPRPGGIRPDGWVGHPQPTPLLHVGPPPTFTPIKPPDHVEEGVAEIHMHLSTTFNQKYKPAGGRVKFFYEVGQWWVKFSTSPEGTTQELRDHVWPTTEINRLVYDKGSSGGW